MRRHRAGISPLRRFAPFDGCRPKALAPLAANVDQVRLARGTILGRQGSTVREVLLVLTGEVIATRDGQDPQRFGPGTQIGVVELLGGTTHPTTLVAGHDLEVLVVYGPAYRWAAQTLAHLDWPAVVPAALPT